MSEEPPTRRPPRRVVGWVLAWLLAAAVSAGIGVFAVTTLGESIRDRGPIGDNELIRQAELTEASASPDPTIEPVRRSITDEFGVFTVECRGVYASGIGVEPDTAGGWRVVSFENGPADDVDAVFANAGRSIDVEVFCNRGEPTVAEIEYNELPDDD